VNSKVELCVYKVGRSFVVTLGERRIAGPKPIYYGKPVYAVKVDIADIQEALESVKEIAL
jgi:hypothetical protein